MRQSRLNEETRRAAIAEITAEPLDLLIIGGGVTGVGAALDAASRGLRVGLVEKDDFGSGTSSKSSKMIHGGLRYLEQLDFALVREALRERGLLLSRLAPHLVSAVPFVMPLRHRFWERLYVGAGVFLYDRLGGSRQLPNGRHLTRRTLARMAPALRADTYVGGIQFWDGQADDARLVICLARTAQEHGALLANRLRAEEIMVEAGRAVGVRAVDTETGREFRIRSRHVATAAGAWTQRLLPPGYEASVQLRPSKGVHIVLPKAAIDSESGILARTKSGLLFAIPWDGRWLIADTDTEWTDDPDATRADRADVQVLLDRMREYLNTDIGPDRIIGVFAGLRPLVAADPSAETIKLSREHAVTRPLPGMSAITGGKLTTYRVMAADLVDAALADLGRRSQTSGTDRIPLLGAAGFRQLWENRVTVAAARKTTVESIERLLRRYGSLATELLDLIDARPELGESVPGADVLGAEVVYACSHEGARHIEDVMDRRTRLAIETPDRGAAVLEDVLELMRAPLGWSEADVAAERRAYLELVQRESIPN